MRNCTHIVAYFTQRKIHKLQLIDYPLEKQDYIPKNIATKK